MYSWQWIWIHLMHDKEFNMNIKTKKSIRELIKIFLFIIIAVELIFLFGAGFAYLSFNWYSNARISFLNTCTSQVGFSFQDFLEENQKNLDIPKDETIIITGKCYGPFNMTAFSNEYLKEDTVIYDLDSKAGKDKYYWAAKIVDGNVSEVWFGKKEINESDMRPYNNQERHDQMKLVIPLFSPVRFFKCGYIDDSEVYGYARFKKTDNVKQSMSTKNQFTNVKLSLGASLRRDI